MALQEHSESISKVKQKEAGTVINYYQGFQKSESERKVGLSRIDSYVLRPDVISTDKPALLKKSSDIMFKYRLLGKTIENQIQRFQSRAINHKF